MRSDTIYEAIVMGASAGGMDALATVLSALPSAFPLPVVVVQHLGPQHDSELAGFFAQRARIPVSEAEDKETIQPAHVYFAPPDYHLLVEPDKTFSLSIDEPVHFARPAIDVLFETAARAWTTHLIGVLLTGRNQDGAEGMAAIKRYGGLTIAQDPETAAYPVMPKAAIDAGAADRVLALEEIGSFLAAQPAQRTDGKGDA